MRLVRPAIAASTTSGAETAKSARWCSPTPMKSTPSSSARIRLVDDVADDLRMRQEQAVRPRGDVAERVQPKLEMRCHQVLCSRGVVQGE